MYLFPPYPPPLSLYRDRARRGVPLGVLPDLVSSV